MDAKIPQNRPAVKETCLNSPDLRAFCKKQMNLNLQYETATAK